MTADFAARVGPERGVSQRAASPSRADPVGPPEPSDGRPLPAPNHSLAGP